MKKLFFVLMVLLSVNVGAATDAYISVEKATNELLVKLAEVQPLYTTEPAKFYASIDENLGPFIDFNGFSRGVMAKYFRRASAAQKQAFAKVFRTSLVETYSKALVSFDNQKVQVMKPEVPSKKPDRSVITLQITSTDGTLYKIDYSLRLIGEEWKLRNLVINGINIGLQFRSQFAASMQKNKNDIDAVIEQWQVDR